MNDNKAGALVEMLKGGNITKNAVTFHFNVDERGARRLISEIAKSYPLIATSDHHGYRIATELRDLEDVKHTYNENRKRAAEILKRNKPLEEFIKAHSEV